MDFVNFSIAKKLKEKGFKEECLCHYVGEDLYYNIESPIANQQLWFSHNKFDNIWHRDNYDAPTISQVLKWLREAGIHINIEIFNSGWFCSIRRFSKEENGLYYTINPYLFTGNYNDYENAEIACIEYALDKLI